MTCTLRRAPGTEEWTAVEVAVQVTRNAATTTTTTASYACSCVLAMADRASSSDVRSLGLPYDLFTAIIASSAREALAEACSLRDDQRSVLLPPRDPDLPTTWTGTFNSASCGATRGGTAGGGTTRGGPPLCSGDRDS